MKQHLTVCIPKDLVFRKEYICPCNSCTQFKFHEFLSKELPVHAYFSVICSNDDEELDQDDVGRTEQICNFIDLPSFVSQLIGSANNPLYFMKK